MTTKNKPAYPGSTAISIKEYFTLPIEERTKVLQSYIELHNRAYPICLISSVWNFP